jgi:CheY-like chemotaxis protein
MKKILIIEDEAVAGMGLCSILELWGYKTCNHTSSGAEAIKKAGREKPDIVLIDIQLKGGITGIEAATEIRKRFGIPVVFITGYSDEKTREKAQAADPVDFLTKPLDYRKLKSILNSVLHDGKDNTAEEGTQGTR